uniref:Uncharacterized protein n=1 Tax=Arundo donax TaxID=35708 RepID=A0A0A9C789_ARUDO
MERFCIYMNLGTRIRPSKVHMDKMLVLECWPLVKLEKENIKK